MAEGGAHHREGWAILSIVFSLGNCIFQVLYERKMCAAAHPERGEGRARVGREQCTGLDPTTRSAESRVGWLTRPCISSGRGVHQGVKAGLASQAPCCQDGWTELIRFGPVRKETWDSQPLAQGHLLCSLPKPKETISFPSLWHSQRHS